MTREDWLNQEAGRMCPLFAEPGAELPKRFQVTMSLTRRTKAIGVCFDRSASADGAYEILVRLDQYELVQVAAILAHDLVHAAVGGAKGAWGGFREGGACAGPGGDADGDGGGGGVRTSSPVAVLKLSPGPALLSSAHARKEDLHEHPRDNTTSHSTGHHRAQRPRPRLSSLRAEVLRHARTRLAAGEAASAIATDLGLHAATLASWLGRPTSAPATFARVEVLAEPPSTAGTLVVHTPQGLRIEGLDLDSLATLLRRLA